MLRPCFRSALSTTSRARQGGASRVFAATIHPGGILPQSGSVLGLKCHPAHTAHYITIPQPRCYYSTTTSSTTESTVSSVPPVPTDHPDQLNAVDSYTSIPDRGFIQVHGPDAVTFLQGLITNHMPKIAVGGGGLYTHFLIPQGRVLYDAIIYPLNQGERFPTPPTFIIECAAGSTVAELTRMLTLRRLRAKVEVKNVTNMYRAWNIWGPSADRLWCWQQLKNPPTATTSATTIHGSQGTTDMADQERNQPRPASINHTAAHLPRGSLVLKSKDVGIWFQDTRAPGMGMRLILPVAYNEPALPSTFRLVSPLIYTLRRMLLGVPEGPAEIAARHALPLEMGLDYMHGVDFRKGCYMGQELTIRTYHTGVVRKRVMPVALVPDRPREHTPLAKAGCKTAVSLDPHPTFQQPEPQADIYHVPLDTPVEEIRRLLFKESDPPTSASTSPAVVSESVDTPVEAPSSPPRRSRLRPAAKYCAGQCNVGLAVVRLESVADDTRKFVVGTVDEKGHPLVLRVLPRIPDWWPQTPTVSE
ncbi:ccr4 associated factor [Dimargaris cristalligena]|uniref:Uncharacterized protein n=1 Tax=Dimargaris cristalligena TaxID=215637 RepID=A0A4P9ZRJ1_9FUNG|nr:ccr4 associated factor [Dimargaris cristalligena]RKP36073.1 hypothetical protein BJ085DRAFT_33017 [Dimargaris cristalligena]|eukprot:RKP36073.1 hypothetical protein BJ085DRAFT_33017 [Dimargaris cristalligena]